MSKQTQKASKTSTKKETKSTPEVVKLTTICEEQQKCPKQVRVRFRKMYGADDISHLPQVVKGGSRWVFTAKDRDAVTKLVINEKE